MNEALPKRTANGPRSAMLGDDAGADVRRAVDDDVEKLVLGGAGSAAGRAPCVAPLARDRRTEAVNARVGEVEGEVFAEEDAGPTGEDVAGVVEVGEDPRVLGRV